MPNISKSELEEKFRSKDAEKLINDIVNGCDENQKVFVFLCHEKDLIFNDVYLGEFGYDYVFEVFNKDHVIIFATVATSMKRLVKKDDTILMFGKIKMAIEYMFAFQDGVRTDLDLDGP